MQTTPTSSDSFSSGTSLDGIAGSSREYLPDDTALDWMMRIAAEDHELLEALARQ